MATTREAAIAAAQAQMELWDTGPPTAPYPFFLYTSLLDILKDGIDSVVDQHTVMYAVRNSVWPYDVPDDRGLG